LATFDGVRPLEPRSKWLNIPVWYRDFRGNFGTF